MNLIGKLLVLFSFSAAPLFGGVTNNLLEKIPSPTILRGNATTAYRDPLLARVNDKFILFYSYVLTDPDQRIYWYTAWSTSTDLQNWTKPRIFTPKDQNLDYSSPGSFTRVGDEWVLALQTIPMNNIRMTDDKLHWPEETSRLWTMGTRDFEHWSRPELIRVKGPDVLEKDMGHRELQRSSIIQPSVGR